MRERLLSHVIETYSDHGRDIAYTQRRGYRIQRWSYRKVLDVSRQFAGELATRDIRGGERILIWGENCAEWVAAFFGSVLRGAVVVPMDYNASPAHVLHVCGQVQARLCVCSSDRKSICPDIPTISLESLTEAVARHSSAPVALPDIDSSEAVEIVFTSGTTSVPKGVVLSHRNIMANLNPLEEEIGKYLKYERIVHPLRFMSLLPLSHMFGQFLGMFIPRILGATVLFQNTLNPSDVIESIRRERVSVLVAVPRVLESLKDRLQRDLEMENEGGIRRFQKQFSAASKKHFLKRWWIFRRIHRKFGWKFWAFICGGAKLGEDTERFWGRLGFALIQGYGLTETTSLISVNHPLRTGSGSIGRILPGREIRLSPDGEIMVRGESIASGYFEGEKGKPVSPVSDAGGWFSTGDMGALDTEGNLYFKGRRKHVIVTSEGMNVYPEDLEAALRRQPEVKDCVVVGLERSGHPEACAVLILHDTESAPEDVIRRANDSLASYQHIRRWCVWPDEDFPRTSTQKPRIGKIEAFAASKLDGISDEQDEEGILPDLIRQVTGRKVTLKPDSSLSADLDLSSIERVELLGALEDRFQVDINETLFTETRTVGDLERMLRSSSFARSDYVYPRWTQGKLLALLRSLLYYVLTWPLTSVMVRPRVTGRDNLDDLRGPVLFVSNHVTRVDVPFILAALPPRFRHRLAVAMLGEMLQEMRRPPSDHRFLKRWVSRIQYGLVTALFNVFPLPQKSGFRESFRFAGESVDRGHSILLFPEGGRTKDGKMQPFQAGIGLLAKGLNLPVVPMRIDGLYALKEAGKWVARPGKVVVKIGEAVRYKPDMGAEEIAGDLEGRVAAL